MRERCTTTTHIIHTADYSETHFHHHHHHQFHRKEEVGDWFPLVTKRPVPSFNYARTRAITASRTMATIRRGAALILLLVRSSWGFRSNAFVANVPSLRQHNNPNNFFYYSTSGSILLAKPKKAGSTVDSYQTVSVNCSKCQQRLFRYKKKNGTKSNLVKCYIERISEDSAGVLALAAEAQRQTLNKSEGSNDNNNNNDSKKYSKQKRQKRDPKYNQKDFDNGKTKEPPNEVFFNQLDPTYSWECPSCNTQFARSSMIHGRPALKLVGGKIRMTKK